MTGAGRLMRAEMAEQPEVLGRLLLGADGAWELVREILPERLAGVLVAARGSSDHAAVFGRYVLEPAVSRPVALAAPSLFTRYGARTDMTDWLAIGVSQSGATPEIVDVLTRLRAQGARTMAITNEAGSPLAETAEMALVLGAGTERAVPATKTFTAQVAAFARLSAVLGGEPLHPRGVPAAVERLLSDPGPARAAAAELAAARSSVHTARGLLFPVALEGALKVKETTSRVAEGLSTADLRHGPVAAVGPGIAVVVHATPGPALADAEDIAARARDRGAVVLAVGAALDGAAVRVPVPPVGDERLDAILHGVRAQQLALHCALALGRDPDHPAGLQKLTPTR